MKKFLSICVLVSLFIGVSAMCVSPPGSFDEMVKKHTRGTVTFVSTNDLKSWLKSDKKIILLDTREAEEYNVSHLKNAIHCGYNDFKEAVIKNKDRSYTVVCYCSIGHRSEKISEKIQKMGFKKVYNLYGGIFDWVNNGNEVVDKQGMATKKIHPYSNEWGKWLTKGIKTYE